MDQLTTSVNPPAKMGRRKNRAGNRLLVVAILVVGLICVGILAAMLWTALGPQATTGPRSAAERDVLLAEAAVEANPKDFRVRVSAAQANLLAGNHDRAIEYANGALQISKDLPSAQLIKAHALAAKGDAEAARKLYDKIAASGATESVEAWIGLAQMETEAGRQDKALELMQKAEAADPMDASLKVELARAQVAAGKPELGLAYYSKALQLVPDLEEALEGLAEMNYGPAEYLLSQMAWEAGDQEEAKRLMEKAVESSPDIPWLYVALGDFRDLLGDATGAEAAYRDALAKDPNNQQAKDGLAALGK